MNTPNVYVFNVSVVFAKQGVVPVYMECFKENVMSQDLYILRSCTHNMCVVVQIFGSQFYIRANKIYHSPH